MTFLQENSSTHPCTPGLCCPAVRKNSQAVTCEQRGGPGRDGHLDAEQGEGEIRAKGGEANGEKERERK